MKSSRGWRKWMNSDTNTGGWEPKTGMGWVYFYSKGMFRGKEDQYVISTSLTGGSNPSDRRNIGFKSKSHALRYARSWIKTH